MVAHLVSPDGSRDELYLGNYAFLQVKDQLARILGVGDVTVFGARDYSMRIWLDPEKLASRNMTAGDVVRAIREQNLQVAAGTIGQPPVPAGNDFQFTISTQGRLLDVSISGAFVSTSLCIASLASITIEVLSVISAARRFKPIEAQVIRRTERGLGIEWKELTAASLSQLVDGGEQLIDMLPTLALEHPAERLAGPRRPSCRRLRREVSKRAWT